MPAEDNKPTPSADLRNRAETFLEKSPDAVEQMATVDIRSLVQELQIHQLELEMQGDELRDAQQDLLKARDKYVDLYDFAPVGYITLNGKGIILEANLTAATLLGVARSTLVGMPFSRVVAKGDQDVFYLHLKGLSESGAQQTCELRLLTEGGEEFHAQLECLSKKDAEGEVEEFRISFSNIERRKKLEAQLRQSQKMETIGQLAGGIAHEFNNVLGIILGNAELAMDDVPKWNPARESLKEIVTASLRAKEVVRQILAFARKSFAAREPFEIAAVAGECLKFLRPSIPATIEIESHIACPSAMVVGNPTEIYQVIINLCTNAAQAMKKTGGTLNIDLSQVTLNSAAAAQYEEIAGGNYIRLMVQDNGRGMTPDILEKIFDPYFTTKDIGQGTGMGLAVVYGIVKRCDGAVRVTSELGLGTTVEVLFPLYEGAVNAAAKASEGLPERGKGERILFVDDEVSMVNLFKQHLDRMGYDVTGMTDSRSALECFGADPQQYDLVITDLAMPHMAGDEMAARMLALRPDIPILLCTGHSDDIDEKRAKELGIRGFLMKPLNRKKLAETVLKLLDISK